MPAPVADLDEVDHLAEAQPIDEIAERSAHDERQCQLARHAGHALLEEEEEDDRHRGQ